MKLLALLLLGLPLLGDTVELKSGKRLECRFKGITPTKIIVQMDGRTLELERSLVKAVYFSDPKPEEEGFESLDGLK